MKLLKAITVSIILLEANKNKKNNYIQYLLKSKLSVSLYQPFKNQDYVYSRII